MWNGRKQFALIEPTLITTEIRVKIIFDTMVYRDSIPVRALSVDASIVLRFETLPLRIGT